MTPHRLLLPALALLMVAEGPCAARPAGPSTGPTEQRLAEGPWGGDGVLLTVTDRDARTEFSCAHGSIDEPIVLDSQGRFEARGTHVAERPGPAREGETGARPARYVGTVAGDRLSLDIILLDPEEPLGTFTLTRGRTPRIVKCQ